MKPRNFLAYGFGISVAVHLVLLPFVRAERTVSAKEVGPDVVYRTRIPTPPPTPHPTPTPRPTQQPTRPPHEKPQSPAPRHQHLKIVTFRQGPPHGGVSEPGNTHPDGERNGVVPGDGATGPAVVASSPAPASPSPAPTPRPTPTPLSCARPNVAATTVHAMEPETPTMAQQQGISGTVGVVVSLDAQSRIVGTHVQTSPSVVLNQAALAAARGSQFRTEVRNCEPVAADYLFSVEFTAQ